jgi:hypothetical protein
MFIAVTKEPRHEAAAVSVTLCVLRKGSTQAQSQNSGTVCFELSTEYFKIAYSIQLRLQHCSRIFLEYFQNHASEGARNVE